LQADWRSLRVPSRIEDVELLGAITPMASPQMTTRHAAGSEVLCVCGNYGCVEAVASAPAIVRQLGQLTPRQGELPATPEELMTVLRVNEKTTVGLLRAAGSLVGEVVANLVHFYNPARIVVGGGLTIPSDDMLALKEGGIWQ
jgi:predicted NBD/HSP70 family sugar kinase